MEYTGKWKGMKMTEEDNQFGKWEDAIAYNGQNDDGKLPSENDMNLGVDEGDTSDYEIATLDKIFGDKFIDVEGNDLKLDCIEGYKIIIILFTVDW